VKTPGVCVGDNCTVLRSRANHATRLYDVPGPGLECERAALEDSAHAAVGHLAHARHALLTREETTLLPLVTPLRLVELEPA